MSEPSTPAAVRAGSFALRALLVGTLLVWAPLWVPPSARAQQAPSPPSADPSPRAATAARPTPNADNESDDSDRRPLNRKTASYQLAEGAGFKVSFGMPKTGGREYAEMESLAAGKVVRFFDSAAIKLVTDVDLQIGETRVRRANVAPDYPGVYSLWLRRTADGWRLVFNDKADVWGTQHDPAADRGSTPLRHEQVEGLSLAFGATVQRADDGDDSALLLVFSWGEHRWTTPLRAASP